MTYTTSLSSTRPANEETVSTAGTAPVGGDDAVPKLRAVHRDFRFAPLTTISRNGPRHCHPMATQETAFDGDMSTR